MLFDRSDENTADVKDAGTWALLLCCFGGIHDIMISGALSPGTILYASSCLIFTFVVSVVQQLEQLQILEMDLIFLLEG